MTLAVFKRCLSTVPKDVEILFAGMAEPWLNPAATDMVVYAHEQGYRVGVYSTVSGHFCPADVQRMLDIPFLHFCIHLPDAGGMMKLKVDSAYLQNLKAAMAISNRHFTLIGKMRPLVLEVVGDQVKDDSPGLLSRAGNLKDRLISKKRGPLQCSAAPELNHNVLLPNGDVVLCCCDYSLEQVLGNLTRVDYQSLFTGAKFTQIKHDLVHDSELMCRRCELSVNL